MLAPVVVVKQTVASRVQVTGQSLTANVIPDVIAIVKSDVTNAAALIDVPLGGERIRLVRLRYQCLSDEVKACSQNNVAIALKSCAWSLRSEGHQC